MCFFLNKYIIHTRTSNKYLYKIKNFKKGTKYIKCVFFKK